MGVGAKAVKTVILCGGKGTRAYPHTAEIPKPLLLVGDQPVLGHVMSIYARQGFTDFVLAAGYRCEMIRAFARTLPTEWSVEVVDTGLETNTGGRVRQCRNQVAGTFFVTYADGLGNVDLHALFDTHTGHSRHATLTTVLCRPLSARWRRTPLAAWSGSSRSLASSIIGSTPATSSSTTPCSINGAARTWNETCCRPSHRQESSTSTVTTASGDRWTRTRTLWS